MSQQAAIFFLRVTDNSSKLLRLCNVIQDHFYKKENVMVAVPSDEAAAYIDQLLWKMPEESFIPHIESKSPSKERIVITSASTNLNQAKVLFNLCPTISPNVDSFQTIYELLDLTHPEKEKFSRERQAAYQAKGLSFEEI